MAPARAGPPRCGCSLDSTWPRRRPARWWSWSRSVAPDVVILRSGPRRLRWRTRGGRPRQPVRPALRRRGGEPALGNLVLVGLRVARARDLVACSSRWCRVGSMHGAALVARRGRRRRRSCWPAPRLSAAGRRARRAGHRAPARVLAAVGRPGRAGRRPRAIDPGSPPVADPRRRPGRGRGRRVRRSGATSPDRARCARTHRSRSPAAGGRPSRLQRSCVDLRHWRRPTIPDKLAQRCSSLSSVGCCPGKRWGGAGR